MASIYEQKIVRQNVRLITNAAAIRKVEFQN